MADQVVEVVDRSATKIEEIHRSIAEIPLDWMRQTGLFERTADDVRDLQEQSIGLAYDVVRDVNRRVGGLVSDLLRPHSADRVAGSE